MMICLARCDDAALGCEVIRRMLAGRLIHFCCADCDSTNVILGWTINAPEQIGQFIKECAKHAAECSHAPAGVGSG